MMPAPIEQRSLTDQVLEWIREGIVNGAYKPGEHHSVQTFVDALQPMSHIHISRAPVREALVRLSELGVVRFARNRGIEIVRPTVKDLEEIFQLRLMVEPPAAARAAALGGQEKETLLQELEREIDGMRDAIEPNQFNDFMNHDVGFHELVLEAAGNRRRRQLVHNLRDATRTLGLDVLLHRASDLTHVMEGHIPVREALHAGDQQKAATLMYHHIVEIGDLLMRQLAEEEHQGGYDPGWTSGIPEPRYPQDEPNLA
jgi:DNA-binding GntR family transcriptional regulator